MTRLYQIIDWYAPFWIENLFWKHSPNYNAWYMRVHGGSTL